MNIQEGNCIIAKFNGYTLNTLFDSRYVSSYWKRRNEESILEFVCYEHDLTFHSSWDQLMVAVEKIESLGYFCTIGKWASVYTGKKGERICVTSVEGNTKILNTWMAVIKFIEWYNNETQGRDCSNAY